MRNLGTGEPVHEATTVCPTQLKIYHSDTHPSRLVLPLVGQLPQSTAPPVGPVDLEHLYGESPRECVDVKTIPANL